MKGGEKWMHDLLASFFCLIQNFVPQEKLIKLKIKLKTKGEKTHQLLQHQLTRRKRQWLKIGSTTISLLSTKCVCVTQGHLEPPFTLVWLIPWEGDHPCFRRFPTNQHDISMKHHYSSQYYAYLLQPGTTIPLLPCPCHQKYQSTYLCCGQAWQTGRTLLQLCNDIIPGGETTAPCKIGQEGRLTPPLVDQAKKPTIAAILKGDWWKRDGGLFSRSK